MSNGTYTLPSGRAAALLKVSTQAVRNWAAAGRLSFEVRFVGASGKARYFFNPDEVARLATERATTK